MYLDYNMSNTYNITKIKKSQLHAEKSIRDVRTLTINVIFSINRKKEILFVLS